MKRKTLICSLGAFLPLVFAAEQWELPLDEPQLKSAPGVEVVAANCQVCHSADYIFTQPPLTRAVWSATVQKMREKYAAPVRTNEVEQIIDYLAANYGKK